MQRREEYIELLEAHIGQSYPALVQLVKQCLHNAPHQRPSTDELLARLQRMREEVEQVHGTSLVKLDMAKMRLVKELKAKDSEYETTTGTRHVATAFGE